jgi:hypothetical protein
MRRQTGSHSSQTGSLRRLLAFGIFPAIVGGLEGGGAVRVPGWMGRVGFREAKAGGRAGHLLGVLGFVGLFLLLAPSANATSLTWAGGSTGRTESAAHWSAAANWEGSTAPTASQALETLTFPHLANSECTSKTQTDTCYLTLNDLSGLSTESIQLDDADDYLLAGEGIALGSSGITAAPGIGASGYKGTFIEMPLALAASQKWSISDRSGSEIEENGVSLGGALTGSPSALNVELSDGPAFVFDNDTEVGPVTIEGANAAGEHIDNGSVFLEDGELNSSNEHPVNLSHVFFAGTGAVGSLTMNDATLELGSRTDPTEGLQASSVKLDSSTVSSSKSWAKK